jgi:flavin reductase (DIM6/NTAB) family NADH-FMN oxidoreductase RutF
MARSLPRKNNQHEGHMSIDAATFRQVLGHYPTGVAVITAMGAENQPLAMVVGTFTSVSLDPPLVGFLPDKNSASWALIAKAGHFCANVLASDQADLCKKLASKDADKFTSVDYEISNHGLPVLGGVVAAIECQLHDVVDAGDHWFVLGRVLELEAKRDSDPLLFFKGRYGGFADLG